MMCGASIDWIKDRCTATGATATSEIHYILSLTNFIMVIFYFVKSAFHKLFSESKGSIAFPISTNEIFPRSFHIFVKITIIDSWISI